mgnify:CR=1 FL=1
MRSIPLTKGYEAFIDDADYEAVSRFKWYAHIHRYPDGSVKNVYARRTFYMAGKRKQILLHRYLLGLDDPKIQADHKNHSGLDNQRDNIRIVTNRQNLWNQRKSHSVKSSRYKGVWWVKRNNKWEAAIRVASRLIHIGYFVSEQEAAYAYNAEAIKQFDEYASLNITTGAVQ